MKKNLFTLLILILLSAQTTYSQERRPIDSKHPLWLVHVDVWNKADPQKIIDQIPDDVKPYVCMNLSLSCQYDTDKNIYKMPQNAVRTFKSWATICQNNGLWFTCQPASGGHTHIQDNDLETFEYFFKKYPNFLGWNYAEQFWGFDEANDKSSSTQASRIALFAKLVPMHHQYGGVLTISFCGNIWSHALNPIGMMKRNKDLLNACQQYPEAILWLYKYTTSSCFYNNESVTFGPFVSGLAKNYGVRYDNCGYNGALDGILGDGPELNWTDDLQNKSNTTVDGYTRRNWGTFPGFRNIWIDMFRKIIDGTMYIPSREEVVEKTKVIVIHNKNSGSDEDKYAAWGSLYDGLYKQTDPFNRNNGQWMDNFCYFKSTGRYGAIPITVGLADDLAKSIPLQANRTTYQSRWVSQASKVTEFNSYYPEVSTGDLYVNRYKNQLVTYTPYSYLNKNKTASANIPLQYNTCSSLDLLYGKLSSGIIREYADRIDFYLNNYRTDTTTAVIDEITINGAKAEPTYTLQKRVEANASAVSTWDAETGVFTLKVKHMGPIDLTINCEGNNTDRSTDMVSNPPLTADLPKQPEPFKGNVEIEAEDMDYKGVAGVNLSNSGWYFPDIVEYAGNGYVDMGTNTNGALRHQLDTKVDGEYTIYVRYCNTSRAGKMRATVNGVSADVPVEKVNKNRWTKPSFNTTLKAGKNSLVLANTSGISMYIDQIIYSPAGTEPQQYKVTVREVENGKVEADVEEAPEGKLVTLKIEADAGFKLSQLRVVNSVFFTMSKTIAINEEDGTVTFTMPDENVTLVPVFKDMTAVYKLDFTEVAGGTLPPGWVCVQENNDTHSYPNSYTSGARTFQGFSGHQGKALYWREGKAEYGSQSAYRLNLAAGDYKLTYAMAAWNSYPKYKVQILDMNEQVVAESETQTSLPNVAGNTSASVTLAKDKELPFTINTDGNYLIRFINMTNAGGLEEYLLLECRVNTVEEEEPNAIELVQDATGESMPIEIYNTAGVKLNQQQKGVNIIRKADGTTRKVLVK